MNHPQQHYSMMKMPCAEIGRALACSSDEDQATVINSLGKELAVICRDPELSGMQTCYIAARLDYHGKLLITALKDFIDIREDEDAKGEEQEKIFVLSCLVFGASLFFILIVLLAVMVWRILT